MLTEALSQMLTRLGAFLPPPPTAPIPKPGVSVVRLQEKQIGLGRVHSVEERRFFPTVHKGIRLAGTVRFQVWGKLPDPLELQVKGLTEAVLAGRETLEAEGFEELNLAGVSTTDHLAAVDAWRQTAEFDVLYEFRREASDSAGGLIARVPVELREEWGRLLVTGDVVLWDGEGTTPLVLAGPASVGGLATLAFLGGTPPTGVVNVTRTREGATGSPAAFPTLDAFLAAVSGSQPASTHARVAFASPMALIAALAASGETITFVDEAGAPRAFESRARAFDPPIELGSAFDRLEVSFEAPHLEAGQVLYLRASRGRTSSP